MASTNSQRLWSVGPGGRPRVRTGAEPETIRALSAAPDGRMIPDTYVSDGAPVVVEQVSGAADPTAGDDDVALPVAASVLKPALLANLLATHTDVIQNKVNEKGDTYDVEVSPPTNVLNAVLAGSPGPACRCCAGSSPRRCCARTGRCCKPRATTRRPGST